VKNYDDLQEKFKTMIEKPSNVIGKSWSAKVNRPKQTASVSGLLSAKSTEDVYTSLLKREFNNGNWTEWNVIWSEIKHVIIL
jgi:hypothetical protein